MDNNNVFKILPVILCGGSGKRLWPLSRALSPKQFLKIDSEYTMFQETLRRLKSIENIEVIDPIIISNGDHRFLIEEQMDEIDCKPSAILLEPEGRNTAPAIAAATIYAVNHLDENSILLIMPSDHEIADIQSFSTSIQSGFKFAIDNSLVVFGVKPESPNTGYGYIKTDERDINTVEGFTEKPNSEAAEEFLKNGSYYWNSGMFLFKPSVYLDALANFNPEILKYSKLAITDSKKKLSFVEMNKDHFLKCPSDSIDYAVMEKAIDNDLSVKMTALNAGWSDLGSWKSIYDSMHSDEMNNVTSGDSDFYIEDSKNNLLYSDDGIIATIGLEDTIVVKTDDAILIASNSKTHKVEKIFNSLKNKNEQAKISHTTVKRPWGEFKSIERSDGYQAKLIIVKPKAKLSLQMHHHRSEHWVVVKGIATVSLDNEIISLKVNQSIFIPKESKHSIENKEDSELKIIEVQIGDYLGEDDIVRFEDIYGREES